MQDVDSPADIQALPEPARARRPRVETEALRLVLGSKDFHRIGGHRHGRRDLGQELAVRPLEPERPVRLSLDPVTFFVDRAVVPTTEEREVRERGGATFGPVAYMMSFTQRQPAAREATAAISMLKGSP